MIKNKILVISGALFVGIVLVAFVGGKSLVRKLDNELFHERLFDAFGLLIKNEDWGTAEPLSSNINYAWLELNNHTSAMRIAHALGHNPSPDTEEALLNSIRAGFSVLEVDIFLDNRGYLRCDHATTVPKPYKTGDCTLNTLLGYVQRNRIWLILDVKSDFTKTGNRIIEAIHNKPELAHHIIFQLYHPAHVAVFNSWIKKAPLAGPIVTAYLSYRSISHIYENLNRLKVKAFTMPLDRLPALPDIRNTEIRIFTHPVHDCIALRTAESYHIYGVYSNSKLLCD